MEFHDNPHELHAAKAVVAQYLSALETLGPDESPDAANRLLGTDHHWRGMHPFGDVTGRDAPWQTFWQPLKRAITHQQRRADVFIAGRNEIDGYASVWVVEMGHVLGLFDAPWLGIRPTRKIVMLRYAEFFRVSGDQIVETASFVDIPHLMIQAGQSPFPPGTAQDLVQPGPRPHDGLLRAPGDPAEGQKTLAAINAMIADLKTWGIGLPIQDELRRSWHEDMLWWGPAGIGATYTIPRYAEQHAGPFRAGFTDRQYQGHVARLAEGAYGGFFGWPSFTAVPVGGFMGMPATGKPGPFRVVDIYRRRDDKLAENWIFIDLLHFWATQGVDLLERATARG